MRPPADFESHEGANGRLTVVLAVLFYVIAFGLCRYAYGNALGFAASSPVPGVYFSWWLLDRGGGGGLRIWWFGETAAVEWLESRTARFDTVARKFRRWLELEVFAPLRQRHEIG